MINTGTDQEPSLNNHFKNTSKKNVANSNLSDKTQLRVKSCASKLKFSNKLGTKFLTQKLKSSYITGTIYQNYENSERKPIGLVSGHASIVKNEDKIKKLFHLFQNLRFLNTYSNMFALLLNMAILY